MEENENIAEKNSDPLIKAIDLYSNTLPLQIQVEICLLLIDFPVTTMGVYMRLYLLNKIGILNYLPQSELIKSLNLSEPTFISYRKILINLGLVNVDKKNRKITYTFNKVQHLPSNFPENPTNFKEFSVWLEKAKKIIVVETPEYLQDHKEQEKETQAQIRLDGIVQEKAKEIVKKKVETAKKEEKRFEYEDYTIVLTGYRKWKGLGLLGNDLARARKAIKNMFLSGHKPKEIVDCMAFFNKYERQEGNDWMRSWTIETIGKKMAEFKIKKIAITKTMADAYPKL